MKINGCVDGTLRGTRWQKPHMVRNTCVPPSHFTWPAFRTVAERMTDSEILRGQFHLQTDMYRNRLQQQITWVQTLLFVLVPLSVIRWQGLQFLEGEILTSHWSPVSLHNNPWEHTTPCGHFDTDTESHLWGIFRDNGHLCLCFMWSVWIYGVDSRWSLNLSRLPKINTVSGKLSHHFRVNTDLVIFRLKDTDCICLGWN